jgi:DNA helicase II / ATP-dependent DNA helicase PcrA
MELSIPQQKAVFQTEGPVLIIAGPGAGKTKTLVERIVHLIRIGVESNSIMVATFTEKAAKELITRVSNRLLKEGLSVNLNEMYIGTLHSIFLRFLEEYREHTRLKRSYRLLDQFDQAFLIFRNLNRYTDCEGFDELLGEQGNRWSKANDIANHINCITEECIDTDKLIAFDKDVRIRAIGHFSKIYQQQLEEENALDFSTILSETLHLLENTPSVLAEYHEKL